MMDSRNNVVDKAVAAGLDALPQRLSGWKLAAAAGVSLWTLQRAFMRAHCATPVANVQLLYLERARGDLKQGTPGDTVFAIVRRWGFTSPDGVFRDGYLAAYRERPSETLKRARTRRMALLQPCRPAADDHVVCRGCGRKMRSLRRHLFTAHGLSADAYRQRWRLTPEAPLVCAEMSRQMSARAYANQVPTTGARTRQRWKNTEDVSPHELVHGDALQFGMLAAKAEELVVAALPARHSECYLSSKLSIGLRTLRRAFPDERGETVYVALRQLRMREAYRRLDADQDLTPKGAAAQYGFSHYARFRRDLDAYSAAGRAPSSGAEARPVVTQHLHASSEPSRV